MLHLLYWNIGFFLCEKLACLWSRIFFIRLSGFECVRWIGSLWFITWSSVWFCLLTVQWRSPSFSWVIDSISIYKLDYWHCSKQTYHNLLKFAEFKESKGTWIFTNLLWLMQTFLNPVERMQQKTLNYMLLKFWTVAVLSTHAPFLGYV